MVGELLMNTEYRIFIVYDSVENTGYIIFIVYDSIAIICVSTAYDCKVACKTTT